jgi:hypothetical protein
MIGGAFGVGGHKRLHFTNSINGMTFPNQTGQQRPVTVRVLGLWDVVAAFGVPLDLGPLATAPHCHPERSEG